MIYEYERMGARRSFLKDFVVEAKHYESEQSYSVAFLADAVIAAIKAGYRYMRMPEKPVDEGDVVDVMVTDFELTAKIMECITEAIPKPKNAVSPPQQPEATTTG